MVSRKSKDSQHPIRSAEGDFPRTVRLSQGTHLSPQDGVCLMEYVSVVAGESFSPEPECTEPAVVLVAGMVNDLMSASARDALVDLVPQLLSARVAGQELTSQVVVAVTATALRLGGPDWRLARHHARATGRLSSRGDVRPSRVVVRLSDLAYKRGGARHGLTRAVAHVLRLPPHEHDAALRSLLESAVGAVGTGISQPSNARS